jgi:Carboxypeptidase regulatory-like domain
LKENFQPGTHPDADQLSIFAEGAANAHERERMMVHLAECAECRSVVFLMQGPAEPEPAMAGAAREWPWRRWLVPAGLAAAALACGLATIAYVRVHRQTPEAAGENAELQTPQRLQKDAGEAAKNARASAATGKPRNEGATRTPGLNADQQVTVGRSKSDERQGLAQASDAGQINNPQAQNLSGSARALSAGAVGKATTQLAPEPQPAPAAPAAPESQKMEVRNRNFAALSSPPFLKIEHNQGPDDGTSRVSGRVTDMTGAVVPGARVTLRDAAGKTRQTTSSGDGSFDLAQVPPGHYDLGVVARGFEGYKQTMDLKPRDMAMLDASLTVGAEAQTVEVTAAAPSVETSSASVVSVQVAELPSRMPAQMTVAVGKRLLSLDADGALFLSRNRGRSWKKVKPQWPGKVDRIEASDPSAAQIKRKTASEEKSTLTFQLTTESGAVWLSEDGTHWRRR